MPAEMPVASPRAWIGRTGAGCRPRSRARRPRARGAGRGSSSRLTAPGGRRLALGAQEQAPLGQVVLLDGRVVVEVVTGEVGEQRGREPGAGRAPLGEGVRGHLHGARRVAGVAHPREQPPAAPSASGVVCRRASARPPTRASMVPMSPHCRPAASSIARIRNDEVVLPLVPVTPTTARSREGWPASAAAASAMPTRASATTAWGTATCSSRSTMSAAAPRATASAAKSWPSARVPRRAQKSAPGPASSARWTIEAMGVAAASDPGRDGAATIRPPGPASISSWRVMRARILPEATDGHHGAMLSVCRENAVMSSNAGAATSPP